MPAKPTIRTLRKRAKTFVECRGRKDLSRLLRVEFVRLGMLAADPKYREYRIPKKTPGKFRLVEDPEPRLKAVQRRLNDYLQAVYFCNRHPAAYGFLTNPVDDPDPRNILTNAERHVGCQWMLNVDMRDFFHLIDTERLRELYAAPLLNFPKNLARFLTQLCTYRDRLPMGAPTSPVLSNLASIPLDQDLQAFADDRGWVYTRYADDLTFSSKTTPISLDDIPAINEWIKAYAYELNPAKSKLFGPDGRAKEVTGLVVGDTDVTLSDDYVHSLRRAITRLSDVIDAKYCMPSGRLKPTPWVAEIEQQVRGRLAFASQVLDEDDDLRVELETAFDSALEPPQTYGPVAWLDFGYTLFNLPRL